MLDVRSPLSSVLPVANSNLSLAEAPGFTLTQLAGADKDLKKALGKIPAHVGIVLKTEARIILRIGPKQVWVLGELPTSNGLAITPLSSGRTRISLSGIKARDVLSSCAAIDFHPTQFKPGQFVMTGIHHTPVMIHCITDNEFHIYALRTFAKAVWEWLDDAAIGVS